DELAFDPRAYDFGHPVNRRPNYQFGEWDPHHLDNSGCFRRFVIREVSLEALFDRIQHDQTLPQTEILREAGTVLAGVILMSTGISGNRPARHDSNVNLSNLLPKIASYRDRYYEQMLSSFPDGHRERLLEERQKTRQPFGGARQHLNRFLARRRAAQMQHVELARLFAEMGYPEASRKQAQIIPVARVRFLSEIFGQIAMANRDLDGGRVGQAAARVTEIENLIHRAVECGAFVDPWNIIGFQGQFSIFSALENSFHDPRVDELVDLIDRVFALYARVASEAATTGEDVPVERLLDDLKRFADWWDQFASVEVSAVQGVSGEECWQSAKHLFTTLRKWREAGVASGDLTFWRDQIEQFNSPKSYSLVIEALLARQDYVAAMSLLIQWLGDADRAPLADGEFSFHALVLRWLLGDSDLASVKANANDEDQPKQPAAPPWPLV
ncbi:MAG: hypothetical protein N2C14_12300, partial [Planctomycetales bacterium]